MKKCILLIILSFLFLSHVTSCKSAQTKTNHIEKQHLSDQVRDTLVVVKTEKITDTLFVKVPVIQTVKQECDTLCQQELDKLLLQIASKKQSGKNQVGFYYDKYQQQLVLYQNLQEQYDTYKSNNQKVVEIKEVEVIKEIPVRYVPRLVTYLAILGGLSLCYFLFLIIKKF